MAPLVIIDDDDTIRQALAALLGHEYEVHTFDNAADAFRHLSTGARPVAILVDASMPGMTGFEFRARQRRSAGLADIPVVLMTGSDVVTLRENADFDAVIAKPFSADEIVPVLHRIVAVRIALPD